MRTIRSIPLKDKDRKAVEEVAALLRREFPVTDVILYGSKAKGTDDMESDIDLLALTSRELDWNERNAITDALFAVQLAHDVVISTLVVPVEEWRQGRISVLPIHDEIEEFGAAA